MQQVGIPWVRHAARKPRPHGKTVTVPGGQFQLIPAFKSFFSQNTSYMNEETVPEVVAPAPAVPAPWHHALEISHPYPILYEFLIQNSWGNIIKWWWFDSTKFGVISYIADCQNKGERLDKKNKFPLDRKLSFEVFFFPNEESILCMQTLFCQALWKLLVSTQINSLDSRFSLTPEKCHPN